ncbi:putative hippurate hydrolase [Nemania sp. FL0031]|nr:putative hippurate hydrolase [Nemania sp. FL0031]
MRDLGFDDVVAGIGGHGVVGIIKNGPGPTVMLRADMDALPQEERTGLPYASTKKVKDKNGNEIPVMHACGHDFHAAILMAVAKLLHSAKERWSGTLECLFQPAEEDGAGAEKMVDDGLFDKVPVPDILLCQHVNSSQAGTIQIRAGPSQSSGDCFDVRIFGIGGHVTEPHLCKNPVITACSIVLRLQTLVSQEVPPGEFAVLSCAYLHAGTAINIIPDSVDMKIDLRTYQPEIREKLIVGLKRVIHAECEASGLPEAPSITQTDNVPAVVNDESIVETLQKTFRERFGDKVQQMEPDLASDDFSTLGAAKNIPYCYWQFGGTDPAEWEKAKKEGKLGDIPSNHSSYFGPAIDPTLQTGLLAMSLAALAHLGCKN